MWHFTLHFQLDILGVSESYKGLMAVRKLKPRYPLCVRQRYQWLIAPY
jgi:hypothetical protein